MTLAGHILRLPYIRQASKCDCSGYLMEAREEKDVQGSPGDKHSRKIYRRCESAGVVFTEWLVIEVGENVSSRNAPAGVEGSTRCSIIKGPPSF